MCHVKPVTQNPQQRYCKCDPLLALPIQRHLQVFSSKRPGAQHRGRSQGFSAGGYLHGTGGFSIQGLHLFAKARLIHCYTAAAALATTPSLTPKLGPDPGAGRGPSSAYYSYLF